jgi:predicted metal-dependent peptidase
VAVDTSGSIDGQILAQFAGEISSIMEDYQTTVRVIYCDSDVNAEETFTSQDAPIILHAHGGGGTDFGPVFDLVDAAEESPACLVYLTDMWGRFPQAAPGYPVLWASTDGEHAPFGELVKLKA